MWSAIDAETGLWMARATPFFGWHLQTVALRLPSGGAVIVSPTRGLGEDVHRTLPDPPRFLLAPNHFHWMGLAAWAERYPEAILVASDGARPRVAKKSGLQLAGLGALPAGVTVLEPPGMRSGEVWLRVETARGPTWVVGDAFFNVAERATGFRGWVMRTTRTTPGLQLGRSLKWLALRDERKYGRWVLERLASDPPIRLVPLHGDVAEGADLADRLSTLVRERLQIG